MVPPVRNLAATTPAAYSPASSKGVTPTRTLHQNSLSVVIGKYCTPIFMLMSDYVAVVLALTMAWYLRATILPLTFTSLTPFSIDEKYVFDAIPLCYILLLAYEGMYVRRIPFWQETEYLFKICVFATSLVVALAYFMGYAGYVSRMFILMTWILSFLFLTFSRYWIKRALILVGLWQKPVVIVGAGKTAELLARSFNGDPHTGYKIVGLIEDNFHERPLVYRYPYMGAFAQAEQAILRSGVDEVFIAVPGLDREKLLDLVYRIQPCVKNLNIVPDLLGFPLGNLTIDSLFNEKLLLLKTKNNLISLPNKVVKRLFDAVFSMILFPVLLPILLLISLMIRLDSPGPILHIANRMGKNGYYFSCYKFRSMYINSDTMLEKYLNDNPGAKQHWEMYAKLKGYDPRITRVGKWLRKYSLDELPQIMNVIKGEMSLVGPRPYLPRERGGMGLSVGVILGTVPGITGLWQVSGRNEIEFQGRLLLDCWYVRNWSVWLDMVLLCKTVKVILTGKGAY